MRFAWPQLAEHAERVFRLADGEMLRIVRAGEEDADNGIYRSAEVEVAGVRRRGDVIFGAGVTLIFISLPPGPMATSGSGSPLM